MTKQYRLLGADGQTYLSDTPGTLGGNSKSRVYGRLECGAARRALPQGYAALRVFFADEAAAIAAGYRPCGTCLRQRYLKWHEGGEAATEVYPWQVTPADVKG